MGLNKSKGNMYDWVSHTWSPIIGCEHQCTYCYVKAFRDQPVKPEMRNDFPPLGKGKKIFVGHLCDMFAEHVPSEMIQRVIAHCLKYPGNEYILQTKNPARILEWPWGCETGRNVMVGTTIETNRDMSKISTAPTANERAVAMRQIYNKTFLTIEPILDFDLEEMMRLIITCRPDFINIGADSKGHGLPEPSWIKVNELIYEIKEAGFEVREKANLERLVRQ